MLTNMTQVCENINKKPTAYISILTKLVPKKAISKPFQSDFRAVFV